MKAIVNERYGSPDDLGLEEVAAPAVEPGRVLVRVRAASVNAADWHLMRGQPALFRPMMGGLRGPGSPIRGLDLAGTVEAVGEGVADLGVGDDVFGTARGSLAELASAPAESLAPKPATLSFEEAAAMPVAGVTALQALRDRGRLAEGQQVLVNGAAGGVGTFAVQIATALGGEVTAVCSARNAELVRGLGALRVVDYDASDFTREGRRYDLVLDNVGNRSLRDLRRALTPRGTLVVVGAGSGGSLGPLVGLLSTFAMNKLVRQEIRSCLAKVTTADLLVLKSLVEAGTIKPVLDRTYPLAEAPEALRYLETGHARAKVVIVV